MSAAQTLSPQDLIASHKAAASRASTWLREFHAVALKPTQALELVASVYGVANWQTLQGLARRGQGPRVAATAAAVASPVSATTADGSVDAELRREFEAAFATGHAPTDKRNFTFQDGRYVQERIQTLYLGFVKGRGSAPRTLVLAPSSEGKSFVASGVQDSPAAKAVPEVRLPDRQPKNASAAELERLQRAANHPFKEGQPIEVENGRTEMLYRGTVLAVSGSRVTVQLPARGGRPYIFDLSDDWVNFDEKCIYTAW